MNVLLDTHILIWALENNPALPKKARDVIIDGSNIVYVSSATVWEMTIKKAIGKLSAPDNLYEEIKNHRFTMLDINFEHAELAGKLPDLHKDPFDRMLIAQSIIEKLTLISKDSMISKYQVKLMNLI